MINTSNAFIVTGTLTEPFTFAFSMGSTRFFTGKISIRRYSGTIDTIPLLLPGRLCRDGEDMTGQRVNITGCLLTKNLSSYTQGKLGVFLRGYKLSIVPPEIFDRNEITLNGCICHPPFYRITPRGREIANLMLAVPRCHESVNDYIPLVVWGQNARIAGRLTPGDPLSLQGRIQSRCYKKQLPEEKILTRIAYEVSVCSLKTSAAKSTSEITLPGIETN